MKNIVCRVDRGSNVLQSKYFVHIRLAWWCGGMAVLDKNVEFYIRQSRSQRDNRAWMLQS